MGNDPVQSMPGMAELTKNNYGPKEWLTYYKNVWTRNIIARAIDVQTDISALAIDPEGEVVEQDMMGNTKIVPIKERLEMRKIAIQDAQDIIDAIDALLVSANDTTVDFAQKYFSKEALAVQPEEKKSDESQAETTEPVAEVVPAEEKKEEVAETPAEEEKPVDNTPSEGAAL